MADYVATTAELKSVADAIRSKGGTSARLKFPDGFNSAVSAIKTGNDTSDATATAADIMHDTTAYIASGKVTGTFSLDTELTAQDSKIAAIKEALKSKGTPPAVQPVIQSKTITANGTYTAPSGVDGYSPVTVNCPTPKPEQSKTIEITANGDTTITPDVGKVLSEVIAKVNVPTGGGGGEEWCNVTITTQGSIGFYGSGTASLQGTVLSTFSKGFNGVRTGITIGINYELKVLKNSIITLGRSGGFPNISVSPNLEYKLNEIGAATTNKPPILLIYVKGDGTVTA